MAVLNIKIETRVNRIIDAIEAKSWTEDSRRRFNDEWGRLTDCGAELVETQFIGGRIVAYPTHDFTSHCAKYGVHP